MKKVIQGDTIALDVYFYNIDPSAGGVPTDPDDYLHSWDIQNDTGLYVSAVTLLKSGIWPPLTTYYLSIVDYGTSFTVNVYSDATRTVLIASTGTLSYGVYTNQALAEVGGSGYTGTINITFPGGGNENFEIVDAGPAGPTYEIKDQNNATVVSSTIFPTRLGVGHYETTYAVSSTAVTGENWRMVARALIGNIVGYVTEYFEVIDASTAVEDAAKLITLDELKADMELYDSNTARDALLDTFILFASKTIEDFCNANFHQEAQVQYFDGNGFARQFLAIPGPIASISKLEERYGNGTFQTVDANNYTFEGFFIALLTGCVFTKGVMNYRITYIAGEGGVPAQINRAVRELCKYWYNNRNRNGVLEDTIGSGMKVKYEEFNEDLPALVKQMANQFRRLS